MEGSSSRDILLIRYHRLDTQKRNKIHWMKLAIFAAESKSTEIKQVILVMYKTFIMRYVILLSAI